MLLHHRKRMFDLPAQPWQADQLVRRQLSHYFHFLLLYGTGFSLESVRAVPVDESAPSPHIRGRHMSRQAADSQHDMLSRVHLTFFALLNNTWLGYQAPALETRFPPYYW